MNHNILIKNRYNEFTYRPINYEINIIHPLIEYERYKIFFEIKDHTQSVLNQYKYYKNPEKIITNWVIEQFKEGKDYYIDPLLPFQSQDNAQLIKNIVQDRIIKKERINDFIRDLDFTNKFTSAVDKIRKFIQSEFYLNNFNKGIINVDIYNEYRLLSIKFNLGGSYSLFTIKIFNKLYQKLTDKYKLNLKNKIDNQENNLEHFHTLLICLYLRYKSFFAANEQLACNPEFYEKLNKMYHFNVELFASSINHLYDKYSSLFYDIEQYFGSIGYYNNINIRKGLYVANPPFSEDIMKNMANTFNRLLSNNNNPLTFLIVIPAWKSDNDYGLYECFDILQKSTFTKKIITIPRERARFFNYFENVYGYPCAVNFIIMQNQKGSEDHHLNIQEIEKLIDQLWTKKVQMKEEKNDNLKFMELKLNGSKDSKITIRKNIKYIEDGFNYNNSQTDNFYLKYAIIQYILYKNIDFKKRIRFNNTNIARIYFQKIFNNFFYNQNFNNINFLINGNEIEWIREYIAYKTDQDIVNCHNITVNDLSINFDPKFNLGTKFNFDKKFNFDPKFNFIFCLDLLNQDRFKLCAYFSEHFTLHILFLETLYCLTHQEKGGSFMICFYTLDLKMTRDLILLLNNCYKEVKIFKAIVDDNIISFVCGKHFKGCHPNIINILFEIKNKLLNNNYNIFNNKKREEYNVKLPITKDQNNKILYNLFNISDNLGNNSKIDKFNREIILLLNNNINNIAKNIKS